MGAWGQQPWDNDKAADLFGDLWEGTPIERYDETLTAAIAAADQVLARADEDPILDLWADLDVDLAARVSGYRATLVARRDRTPDG